MWTVSSRRWVPLVEVAVGERDHCWPLPRNLKRAWHPVISFPPAMKRLVGIVGCLFLFLASAVWALEKCQDFDAHPSGHKHAEEAFHTHAQGIELPRNHSLPGDQTIHCADSRAIPIIISQSSPRLARSNVAYRILPSLLAPVIAEANGWFIYSEKRPPGWFLSAVATYLSLSVLRF